MEKKFKAIFISCLVFLLLGIPVSAATTGTTEARVTVQGGELGITIPDPTIVFSNITIDGATQTLEMDLGTMIAFDFTGTGSGWNITVGATQFSETTHKLPFNSLTLGAIDTIEPVNTTSTGPSFVETAPYTLDNEGGTAQKILTATAGNGMGKFNVAFASKALKLAVNSSILRASATPYTSTITYSIVTGP